MRVRGKEGENQTASILLLFLLLFFLPSDGSNRYGAVKFRDGRRRGTWYLRPVMISMVSTIVLGTRISEDVMSIRADHLIANAVLNIIVDSTCEEEAVNDGSGTTTSEVVPDVPLSQVLEVASKVGRQVIWNILELSV